MRRLLILLLIFLLPVQVFAGMGELHADGSARASAVVKAVSATEFVTAAATAATAAADPASADTDTEHPLPLDESGFSLDGHAGFGDDTVLSAFSRFSIPEAVFFSMRRNDAAPIAPYLPPAARPPRA